MIYITCNRMVFYGMENISTKASSLVGHKDCHDPVSSCQHRHPCCRYLMPRQTIRLYMKILYAQAVLVT